VLDPNVCDGHFVFVNNGCALHFVVLVLTEDLLSILTAIVLNPILSSLVYVSCLCQLLA